MQALDESPSDTTVVGVFGYFGELRLAFSNSTVSSPAASGTAAAPAEALDVWAQDLVGGKPARKVTSAVRWEAGPTLVLPGALLRSVGQEARSRADDVSPPGLVLRLATVDAHA